MARSYYTNEYAGKSWGWIAVLVGAACIYGFFAWVDHSSINEPVTNAKKELQIERSLNFPNPARIKACEEDLARARKYVASGQSKRNLRAHEAEVNKGSHTMGDVIWACLSAVGTLVLGWRTLRGVASPFEVFLALVSTTFAVILTLSIGIGAFLMLVIAGMLVLLAFRVLGDDVINRARWVRDEYDEEFDVNERRAARASRPAPKGRRGEYRRNIDGGMGKFE